MNSDHQTNDRLTEPVVLLFQTSPFGTLDAIVQHDGKSVYFYLNQPARPTNQTGSGNQNKFGTRACWVRNIQVGPLTLNEDEMRQGISPMLPRTQCIHRDAQPIPQSEQLSVVWLEEGNGAALIESLPDCAPVTLAVIPPWSGIDGFHGYSSQCAIESPLCWPMPDHPGLNERIERAFEFWQRWGTNSGDPPNNETGGPSPGPDPFAELQPEILRALDAKFCAAEPAPARKYYSIDGGQFPPRGLVRYQTSNEVLLATVGMSICPQPAVELFTDDPINYRRIELAIRLQFPEDSSNDSIDIVIESVAKQLSGLASHPWKNFTWLGPGHTCPLHNAAPNCESALLARDQFVSVSEKDRVRFPKFRNDPINLLWLIPITNLEQQQLRDQSTNADEIIKTYLASCL